MFEREDIEQILEVINCDFMGQDFEFRLQDKGDGWTIQVRIPRPDTFTGEWGLGGGGKYYVSPYSTEDEIVKKCFAACMAYAEHEVREGFNWKGRRVFGPHIGLDALWEAAPQTTFRDPPQQESTGKFEVQVSPTDPQYLAARIK